MFQLHLGGLCSFVLRVLCYRWVVQRYVGRGYVAPSRVQSFEASTEFWLMMRVPLFVLRVSSYPLRCFFNGFLVFFRLV